MQNKMAILKKTRENLLKFVSELTVEQLNEIPAGFNNNIVWNLGHLLVTQQGMCYSRAGLERKISDELFDKYKPDTKPSGFVDASEISTIKELFISLVEQFETDWKAGLFANYTSWTNRFDIELTSIDEAMNFVLFHEGIHRGYIMALKRLVKK